MENRIIETHRLYLREFNPLDAENLFELNTDKEVMRYTGDDAFASVDAARRFIEQYDHYQKYKFGRWAVIHKANDAWLGWCGLKFHEENKKVDLGFRFRKQSWGNGFAFEAASACINYGFNELSLPSIIGRSAEANQRSIELLMRLGMKFKRIYYENEVLWKEFEIVPKA